MMFSSDSVGGGGVMSGKEGLSTVHGGDLKGRDISTGDPRQCLRSVSVSSGISGEYGISRLGDSVEVFLTVEDGDGVGMITAVLLRRGVETVVVDPDITGIDFCLDAHRT
jgi:hypothetical protein